MRAVGAALLLPLTFAVGCAAPEGAESPWWAQRQPDGPCWQVNLKDGLDTETADEVHGLYRCLNQDGGLDSLAGLDEAMDASSRQDRPLGGEVGLLVRGLAEAELDVFETADVLLALLEDEDRPVEPAMELLVELLYAQPYAVIAGGGVTLESESALEGGAVVPLLPVVSQVSTALLDDDGEMVALASDALASDMLDDGVCTVVGLASSEDDEVVELRERLLPDLGAALDATHDASNDRWDASSGDSLRDLLEATLLETRGDGKNAIAALSDDLTPILENEEVRDRLAALLDDLARQGALEELPLWAQHLAEVDVDGTRRCSASITTSCSDADSALTALVRLLATANTEVECSVIGLEVFNDNLAIELLITLAGWESDTIESLNQILGDVLGYEISGDLLGWVLTACSGIDDTEQLVSDLGSLERLNDPESGQLLTVLVDALGALYDEDAGLNELEALANLLTIAHDRDLLPPVEEVLHDLAGSALMSDLGRLVPLLLDPSPLEVDGCPEGSAPLDFPAIWALLKTALTEQDRGEAPLLTLQPVLNAALGQEGTWTAIDNLAGLMQEDEATLQQALPLVAEIVAADPDLSLVADLAPLLEDDEVREPLLRIAESRTLTDALGHTELSQEGPLPFAARLVTGGTVDSLLRTLDLLLDTLGA